MIGSLNPGSGWEIFYSPPRPDGSETHPASYPMGIRGPLSGKEAAGA